MDYKLKLRYPIYSFVVFIVYFLGIIILSYLNKMPWRTGPAFWVEIIHFPFWVWLISAITIITGTALIYFIPGIFIARGYFQKNDDLMETFAKGFLINYFLYFWASTIYKILSVQEFRRETYVILIISFILIYGIISFRSAALDSFQSSASEGIHKHFSLDDINFTIFYFIVFIMILLLFWKKIFIAPFCSDGVEQFWLAHSVKTEILPTFYENTPATFIPQFPFAPSVYINMFALSLFGNSEFVIRLEVLVAFVCLGFILKELIGKITKQKLTRFGYYPLFLYLTIFFIVIAYRSFYHIPTGLAKSNETMQLCFFLAGFYFLILNKRNVILPATMFVLASMIRYNGFFIIAFFIILYSVLFRNYKCLLIYCLGILFFWVGLGVILAYKHYSFSEMWKWLMMNMYGLYQRNTDFMFFLAYFKNFILFTAGLPIIMFFNLKNKYSFLISITTFVYLLFPIRSFCVPAHFFVPVLMFPLLNYYLIDWEQKKIITVIVIIFEVLSLFFVFPKKDTNPALVFRKNLLKICINTDDLFEAHKRCRRFNELMNSNAGTGFDPRLTMYYGDLMPKQNKEYLLYLGTLPVELSKKYHEIFLPERPSVFKNENTISVYFKNGQQNFNGFVIETAGDYYSDRNEPYIVSRD